MGPRSRWLLVPLFIVSLFACDDASSDLLAPDEMSAKITASPPVTVMSQNLYLGANIDLLLTASTPVEIGEVFTQLTTSTLAGDFGRAQALALQIVQNAPHLVGLQEVTTYTFETSEGTLTLDFLWVLQQYLDYFRFVLGITPHTYTAIRNDLTTMFFPASIFDPSFPDVTYSDADAILVRNDVEIIGSPDLVVYEARELFSVGGFEFDNVRGYQAVTARIGDQVIRFGNTHLEVQLFEDTQLLQTAELIEAFADETLPMVLVGDFNSAANHDAPETQKTASYHMLRRAGYADLWLRERHSVDGYTCCQGADLTNDVSELGQRLDLVLVRYGRAGFGGQASMDIVGEETADRVEVLPGLWLWPSDHAGVVASFWAAPGLKKVVARR